MEINAILDFIHQDLNKKGSLVVHSWLFTDIYCLSTCIVVILEELAMLANDPLKINNIINTFLINANIFLYYSTRLNIYEWKEYHQHQCFHNQPKNDVSI